MSRPVLLQAQYGKAIQDIPRHLLPAGSVWAYTDCFPNRGAPVRRRGGWTSFGIFSGATSTSVRHVAVADFSAGKSYLALVVNGSGTTSAWGDGSWSSVSGYTSKSAIPVTVFFNDKLYILGGDLGTPWAPLVWTGGASISTASGSPPSAPIGTTHKSRLVLASGTTVSFSGILDATTWDVDSFINATYPVTGICSLGGSILLWSKKHTEVIRGSVPPTTAGGSGDMELDGLFDEGCLDHRSIVVHEGKAIWAGKNGVFITDGASIENIAQTGGMQRHWESLIASYGSTTNLFIAGGYHNGCYFVSVNNTGSATGETWMIDLGSKSWAKLTNMATMSYAEDYGKILFGKFSTTGNASVGNVLGLFEPVFGVSSDGNFTSVLPVLELPFYRGNPGSRRWKNLYVGIDLDADDNTTYIKASYTTDPEATSYTDITNSDGSTFKITTAASKQRVKIPLGVVSEGIGVKLTQVGSSNDTQFYDIEADVIEREPDR